ncbi:hypothetical protein HPB48_018392 [Haemaphysalis longicornis]|uniref:Uncharacterized protein n=1 Tax=Haemaphysalis longicornis TaxID=44386 RepID=A0A9J6GDY0_HAELO|nr:hypothetical protein HPB48_018392 [Haemaphysalis longicornis]
MAIALGALVGLVGRQQGAVRDGLASGRSRVQSSVDTAKVTTTAPRFFRIVADTRTSKQSQLTYVARGRVMQQPITGRGPCWFVHHDVDCFLVIKTYAVFFFSCSCRVVALLFTSLVILVGILIHPANPRRARGVTGSSARGVNAFVTRGPARACVHRNSTPQREINSCPCSSPTSQVNFCCRTRYAPFPQFRAAEARLPNEVCAECEGSLQATLTRTSGSSFGDARGSFGGAKLIFLGEIVLPRKRFANGEMLLEYEGFNFGRVVEGNTSGCPYFINLCLVIENAALPPFERDVRFSFSAVLFKYGDNSGMATAGAELEFSSPCLNSGTQAQAGLEFAECGADEALTHFVCRCFSRDLPRPAVRSERIALFVCGTPKKVEAVHACEWLRQAGFPQYVQMYEDNNFPVEITTVLRDHPSLDPDELQSLFRCSVLLTVRFRETLRSYLSFYMCVHCKATTLALTIDEGLLYLQMVADYLKPRC